MFFNISVNSFCLMGTELSLKMKVQQLKNLIRFCL